MNVLNSVLYFIVAIGILVFIHEFGHFIMAKLSKMRVDVFSLGMGYRLFGWNKRTGFSFGKLPSDLDLEGETDYRVALFPIGGYVKIAGMIDESMDVEFANKEPMPWEFRSKNALQKSLTISGGVLMNFVFAIFAFAFLIGLNGKTFWATTEIGFVADSSIASSIGFLPGDKVVKIDGEKIAAWNELVEKLTLSDLGTNKTIEIERNGKKILLKADGEKLVKELADKKPIGLYPKQVKTLITQVSSSMPAGKIGLKAWDTIVAVNSVPISELRQFQKAIKKSAGKTIELTWKRGDKILSDSVKPTKDGLIGVGIAQVYTGPAITKKYGFFEAVAAGAERTYNSTKLIVESIWQMITGKVSFRQSVGGPIAIAKMASSEAERGFSSFVNFLALLSVMLAVVNILPFPGLDGGHMVFILIEAVTRKEVPTKAKIAIQQFGMAILLLFTLFVIYIDLTR